MAPGFILVYADYEVFYPTEINYCSKSSEYRRTDWSAVLLHSTISSPISF